MKVINGFAIALALALPAAAGSFQNGDFEAPGGVASMRNLGCGDTFVPGWINDASSGCMASPVYPGSTVAGEQDYQQGTALNGNVAAYSGLYYVVFGDNGTTGGTLQQTFDTVSGETYNVNYFLSLTVNTPGQPQSMMVQALDGTSVLGTETDMGFSNMTWLSGPTLTFTADSTATTLIFTDTTGAGLGDEQNWGLDSVTVTGAVPEPGSISLILLGLAAGSVLRRRLQTFSTRSE